ncbi:hypothetical protein C0Q70_14861 [Pomacea canaliculata]|uniref:UspA domain-containing protein n=1 Tax=Pomacea canaliculata TaxID=400727 RepID=A0A2T7NT83_POMCA|nr:hypothetical protein C0Q70_14861 [Pomacea canaliculata]
MEPRYRDYVHKPDFFVVLLHCTDHDDQEIREASPARTAKIIKDMAERMKTIEEKFGHLMTVNGIKGKIRKGKGKPGEAIIKAANDEGACMIVCGTRGHGKIKRAFLGSVSDYNFAASAIDHHPQLQSFTFSPCTMYPASHTEATNVNCEDGRNY